MNLLKRLPIDGFVVSILATVGIASLLPARGAAVPVTDWTTTLLIGALFFLYGARLSFTETMHGLRSWRLQASVVSVTFLVFPLIGIVLLFTLNQVLPPALLGGLVFVCLLPSTVQSSIAFTSIAGGNVPGAVVAASLSNTLGVVVTPLLAVLVLGGAGTTSTAGGITFDGSSAVSIVLQLLLPYIAGQIAHRWLAGWLAKHRSVLKIVERGSILVVVYSAFSEAMRENVWAALPPLSIVLTGVLCIVILAIVLGVSTLLGRVLGLERADRIVLLFCGSKKSLAAGLPMAGVLFGAAGLGMAIVPLMLFHQIQLIVCAVLAGRMGRRTAAAAAEAAAEAARQLAPPATDLTTAIPVQRGVTGGGSRDGVVAPTE
ncbi:bile acid:sodium symporter family protein [Plantibacter sp. Mn2098]|uniref:bile acid:sodium symporter family protein n=1 Tax=Plantibacter sp. Mn2098 TaxID=3395266 RepID=UPI003BEC7EA9